MARLTKRYEKSGKVTLDAARFGIDQTVLDTEINNSEPVAAAVKRLAEYEDAEEKGLLVRLPDIPFGATLYQLWQGKIHKLKLNSYQIRKGNNSLVLQWHLSDNGFNGGGNVNEFGKTVFLTPEAAKQALKERDTK